MLQQGAGSSGEQLRDPGAASELAAEFSSKGRDVPVVPNLPEAKPSRWTRWTPSSEKRHKEVEKGKSWVKHSRN
jgi:hypothetical protein